MINLQLRKIFKEQIKKPPEDIKYIFLTDVDFLAENLLNTEMKYLSVYITPKPEENAFTTEEFISLICTSEAGYARDYYYLPICTAARNKQLQSALKANYFKYSGDAWKVFRSKSKNTDYFKQHEGELVQLANDYIRQCEGTSTGGNVSVPKPQLGSENQAALIKQIAASEEWGQPISFDSITLPQFPIDCLPSPLSDYVLAVSEATQTPVDMAAVAAIAVMAVCVQGKYKVQGKLDWIEPLNLYSVIVANPAERKSAILNLLTKYVDEYEYKENERLKPEIDRNRLDKKLLQKEIDRLIDVTAKDGKNKAALMAKQDELTEFEEIKPIRLLADDASAEALTSLLAANYGKMAVISSEGGIFEILQGRYTQSVNIDTFLKAHCGDPIRVDRKGRDSEYIKEPCLTVLLSIQPQVLDGLITNEVFRGRGLTARFLYSMPVSSVGNRKIETESIPQEYKSRYRELCFDLLDIKQGNEAELLKLSDEAYTLSANFARELEPRLIDDLDNMADFAGKLHGAVLRIAGILHIVNQLVFAGSTPIPSETMQSAIKIGYYFLEHARAAYQLMGADEQIQGAKYVLKKLENQSMWELAKYDIFRMCRGKYKKVDEILPSLELLIEYGYLKEKVPEQSTDGRPKENRYILNAKYFG